LGLFAASLSSYVSRIRSEPYSRNDLLYMLGFATERRPTRIGQVVFGSTSGALSQDIVAVALLKGGKTLTRQSAGDLRQLVRETGAAHIALLTATPKATDPDILRHLQEIRSSGAEILLFDWTDATLGIVAKAIESDPHLALQRARTRFLETLNMDE